MGTVGWAGSGWLLGWGVRRSGVELLPGRGPSQPADQPGWQAGRAGEGDPGAWLSWLLPAPPSPCPSFSLPRSLAPLTRQQLGQIDVEVRQVQQARPQQRLACGAGRVGASRRVRRKSGGRWRRAAVEGHMQRRHPAAAAGCMLSSERLRQKRLSRREGGSALGATAAAAAHPRPGGTCPPRAAA